MTTGSEVWLFGSAARGEMAREATYGGYGSLLLQHVRAAGRPVCAEGPSRVRALMTPMSNYTRADSELASFGLVVDDVERSLITVTLHGSCETCSRR